MVTLPFYKLSYHLRFRSFDLNHLLTKINLQLSVCKEISKNSLKATETVKQLYHKYNTYNCETITCIKSLYNWIEIMRNWTFLQRNGHNKHVKSYKIINFKFWQFHSTYSWRTKDAALILWLSFHQLGRSSCIAG